jgi:hypothetical protein
MGPAAMTTFECAHRMNGHACDRREFFLRVAGRFAERFELHRK